MVTKLVLTSCGGTQYLCQSQSSLQSPIGLLPFQDRKPVCPKLRRVLHLSQTWEQDIVKEEEKCHKTPVGKRALPEEGNDDTAPVPEVLLHLIRLEADREVELPPLHRMERERV